MASGIYVITNRENGRVYIGSTTNFERRWWTHRWELRKGSHGNPSLQNSWNKYGEDAFEFGVLEYLDNLNELVKAEQFWMDVYREEGKELYNCGMAADCPARGRKLTEEHKHKLSVANRGRKLPPVSEETRRKIGNAGRGRAHTEETKRKISEAGRGRVLSEETRQKMSRSKMGHSTSEETRSKIRKALKGRKRGPMSEETKRRISKANKVRWAKKKLRRRIHETQRP